ncbi:uncharacterized protein LOC115668258 [Syzygium oleosum]|uniref:uncharacterized protein LOC115668258 n=1 Tax=Syzygium oleosum TaxID=219896 RepID=UPI0011D217CA|nr:uncharacterized protein LOC115668258 [Syzygium oleosum]
MVDNSQTSSAIAPAHEQLNSPYFMHPSDNPGSNLVGMVLTGDNYNNWSRAMEIALSAKNKMVFVIGEIKKQAAADPTYASWIRVNNMILSWILNSIHPDLVPTILYTESVADVWADLRERFSPSNGPRVFHLGQKICTLAQHDDAVTKYYNNLRSCWDELNNLDPLPQCSCSAHSIITKQQENRRLFQFIMGLNLRYANVISKILLMDPLPSVARAYALVLQDESHRHIQLDRPSSDQTNTLLSTHGNHTLRPYADSLSHGQPGSLGAPVSSANLAKRTNTSRG